MEIKRKILFIQHFGSLGGSGVSLLNTVLVLNEKFDVVVYCPSNPNTLGKLLESKNINVKYYSFICGQLAYYNGGLSLYRFSFWKSFVIGLTQLHEWKLILNQEKPDIVMVNSKVLAYIGLILEGYISVCFVRETIPKYKNKLIDFLQNFLLNKFKIVSFLSKYDAAKTNISETLKLVAHDFSIKEREYLPKYITSESNRNFNLLFVGGGDPIKGLDKLIKAINYLKQNDIKLFIAGNISNSVSFKRKIFGFINSNIRLLNDVSKYIEENSLKENIKIIGLLKNLDLSLEKTDVLIVPMNVAHQSRPAFEIGFYSKPVIISNFENIEEFFMDQYNCLTFKHDNYKDLANKILRLKNDKLLLKNLGENNYKMSLKYHLPSTLDKLIERLNILCTM